MNSGGNTPIVIDLSKQCSTIASHQGILQTIVVKVLNERMIANSARVNALNIDNSIAIKFILNVCIICGDLILYEPK